MRNKLKKYSGRKSHNELKILDPVLPCKNPEKISVGYGICDDFPFYDVNACQHSGMNTLKKEKFRKQEKEDSFISKCCRNLEFNPSKRDKIQIFFRVLPEEEKSFTKAKPEPPAPYKPVNCRSGEARTFLLNLNGGLEICWTLQRQV